jgi:hypothetical protein
MRNSRSYFKGLLRKRFIDLVLMIIILFPVIFWVFQLRFVSSTGTITLIEDHWYINYQLHYTDTCNYTTGLIIANPENFPETLKLANDGKEVYYIYIGGGPVLAILRPWFVRLEYIDLIHIYVMKQYFFYSSVILICFSILSYLYLSRDKFAFTTKMFN